MLCPKCKHKVFSRKIIAYSTGLIDDVYCPICGWSEQGSQNMNAQAEHDTTLAKLKKCSVSGCPNRIPVGYENGWGMCGDCASRHRNWLNSGKSKHPPFIQSNGEWWRPNPLAGQWKNKEEQAKAMRRPKQKPTAITINPRTGWLMELNIGQVVNAIRGDRYGEIGRVEILNKIKEIAEVRFNGDDEATSMKYRDIRPVKNVKGGTWNTPSQATSW